MVQTGAMKPFQQISKKMGDQKASCWNQFFLFFCGSFSLSHSFSISIFFLYIFGSRQKHEEGPSEPLSSCADHKTTKNHLATGFYIPSSCFLHFASRLYLSTDDWRLHLTSSFIQGLSTEFFLNYIWAETSSVPNASLSPLFFCIYMSLLFVIGAFKFIFFSRGLGDTILLWPMRRIVGQVSPISFASISFS